MTHLIKPRPSHHRHRPRSYGPNRSQWRQYLASLCTDEGCPYYGMVHVHPVTSYFFLFNPHGRSWVQKAMAEGDAGPYGTETERWTPEQRKAWLYGEWGPND